jgi:hypothetical protein
LGTHIRHARLLPAKPLEGTMLPIPIPVVSEPLRASLVARVGLLVHQALPFLPAGIVAAVPLTTEVLTADEEPRMAESAEKLDENREVVHPAAPDE